MDSRSDREVRTDRVRKFRRRGQKIGNMLNLFIAGLFEIGWALGMKFNHGFTRFWPSAVTLACMAGSLGFLSRALKSMPIGTAYAVWTGIGAAGTAIIGIVLFSESRSVARLLCIALIIVGVAGLQLATQKGNQSRIKTAQSPHRDGPMTRGELSTLPEQGSSLLLTCSSVLAGPRNLACLQQIPTALRPQNSKTSEGRTIPPDDPGEVARTKVSLR